MNKRTITFLFIISLLLIIISTNNTSHSPLQKSIASKLIRFHVIANSNSSHDQQLKLLIKDSVVDYIEPKLRYVNDIQSARAVITDNIPHINTIAQNVLKKHNSSYSVNTFLSTRTFPIKEYGDITLPAGTYESVIINIGAASGRNWWCILYPSLCFIDSTYSTVPNKDKLAHTLTSTEYEYIVNSPGTTVRYSTFISKLFNLN